jgi:hypothetical protein
MTSEREERTERFIIDCLLEDYRTQFALRGQCHYFYSKDRKKLVKALKRVLAYYGVDVDKEIEK